MAKKTLFWSITTLLVITVAYVMTATVIIPVVTRNPLSEAIMPKVEEKTEKNSKKPNTADNTSKKAEKGAKGAKKQEAKVQNKTVEAEEIAGSKENLYKLFELRKTEALLRSRYNLSAEDSVYLVLDLINKTVCLELKGVQLYESKIHDFSVSNSIRLFHTETLLRWIAQPFIIKSASATIARVPIAVINAPKDTIEANMKEELPTAPKREDVHIVMNFERNLQLIVQQEEMSEGEGKMKVDSLKSIINKREIDRSLKSLTTLKRELITPQIVITIPKADATIIYRALPQKPKMVLRL